MKKDLLDLSLKLLGDQHFDSLAVGVIDFKNKSFESFEISATNVVSSKPYLYFDLASLTKALTNSAIRLHDPKLFAAKEMLLLNHIAGLPSGGLLSKHTWREEILSYDVKLSPTLYSDYSSLRCMLEIEKKSGKKLRDLCSFYFDSELLHWKDLPLDSFSPEYGVRNKKIVSGEVHDNNCFNIGEFVSHAGLFATVDGLCKSLINLEQTTKMIETLKEEFKTHKNEDRFILGFDHVMDPEATLAGKGAGTKTFGHLGFTGTSFWINSETSKGAVILANGTQTYWYDKAGLNHLRRTIGEAIWKI
ncbi:MAG: beta-lactamase family protein [Bdellovibrionales bacterium]|nr:beta-lactamase family protein [Bdellovibrionales bacterium]